VCAPICRARRAREIQVGLAVHEALGGGVEFVTLTIQHHRAERLAPLLDLVANGFRAVCGSGRFVREWYLDREALGIVGTIRTLEVNHGENGWHPHLHVLVLTRGALTDQQRSLLADGFWHRWAGHLGDRGHHSTTRERGLVAVAVRSANDVARYMSKVYDNVHHEMARADMKAKGGRNPFRILADLVKAGRADRLTGEVNRDFMIWREYELAIKGRRFLTWSDGLKGRLGVNEVSDDELVAQEVDGEQLAVIGTMAWRSMRGQPWKLALALSAAERHGEAGVYQLLDCWADERVAA
jgi:hypothetical protein